MKTLTSKFGLDDVYPRSSQVLLWIATAVVGIISATWAMVGQHEHDNYVRVREFDRVINSQDTITDRLKDINATLVEQGQILVEVQAQLKWQRPQEP